MMPHGETVFACAAARSCAASILFIAFMPLLKMRELCGDAVCARLGELRAVRHASEEEQLSCAALRGCNRRQGGGDSQEGDKNVSGFGLGV